jgi:hypothetical protein
LVRPLSGGVGAGKHILLADLRQENSDVAAKVLSEAGFEVSTTVIDVSSGESVRSLVERALWNSCCRFLFFNLSR